MKKLMMKMINIITITRKMVPITGRAHSLHFWSFQQKKNREEGRHIQHI